VSFWIGSNGLFVTALIFLCIQSPETNPLPQYWNSTFLYVAHSIAITTMWTIFNTTLGFFFTYILLYFVFCFHILKVKYRQEVRRVEKYKVINLREHQRLLDEMRQLDRFWRWYFAYSEMIATLIFCFALHMSLIAKVATIMRITIGLSCFIPIGILVINSWLGASGMNFTCRLAVLYHNTMVRKWKTMARFAVKIKV